MTENEQMDQTAQSWAARKVVGVDIDGTLVRGAWRRRRTTWSLQAPDNEVVSVQEHDEKERPKKRLREEPGSTVPDYFPASFEHTFGSLPIPPSQHRGIHTFPHNVSFRTADWVNNGILEDKDGYDVIIACVDALTIRSNTTLVHLRQYRFSISKWIHLNGGDDALIRFFDRVHSVLDTGGVFILEPQAWDTYAKAKRMNEVRVVPLFYPWFDIDSIVLRR
jgi:7SK snRNA methylphosphate capping enzyme